MNELQFVAYIDESKKPVRDRATHRVTGNLEHYVVVAAVLLRGDQGPLRGLLTEIRNDLGKALHYSDLSLNQRSMALEAICTNANWDCWLFETKPARPSNFNEARIRHDAISTALPTLHQEYSILDLTLETRATPSKGFAQLDQDDHATLRSLIDKSVVPSSMRLRHADKHEPLLWLPDLLAGARSDLLTNKSEIPFQLCAHRVSGISEF